MVYAYDQWAQLPVRDLYDSLIMAMAINAARDIYEKGLLEMKDFQKAYGDFMTPIMADQDWWNQNVTGKVRDAVNALYAQGIDPLRNPQGRAMISLMINTMPYGEMAKKQLRAKNAEEYYKNMAALQREGKYNKAFSEYLEEDPNMWDANSAGITSPTVFKDLNAATSPWVDDLDPTDLGLDPTGMYRMSGVTSDQIRGALTPHLSGFVNSSLGRYYYDAAKAELIKEGNNTPTDNQVMQRLQDNIVTAQHEKTKVKYTEDAYAKAKREHDYNIAEQNNSARNQMKVHAANADKDFEIWEKQREKEFELAEQYGVSKPGTKGSKGSTNDSRYISYLDDVRESALQSIAGNTTNYSTNIKPNLDNTFTTAWKVAGLTVDPKDPIWVTRSKVLKLLDDLLKSGDQQKYDQIMSRITNYMENKLSVKLEPLAFLPNRAHDNNDPLNQEAIVFDPEIDMNRITGMNDAVLEGYGSVVGTKMDGNNRVWSRKSDEKKYRKYISDLYKDGSVSQIRFRSVGKLIPMFNKEDGKVHFYSKIKVYGVDANGNEDKDTAFITVYDWDSLESGKNNIESPIQRVSGYTPMTNLDYNNRGVSSAMVESMAANNLFGAKKNEYKSDDPQLQQ